MNQQQQQMQQMQDQQIDPNVNAGALTEEMQKLMQ